MQTILYHAKLYVARGDFRSALCAEDGIIRAVGSDAEILALGPARGAGPSTGGAAPSSPVSQTQSAPHATSGDAL